MVKLSSYRIKKRYVLEKVSIFWMGGSEGMMGRLQLPLLHDYQGEVNDPKHLIRPLVQVGQQLAGQQISGHTNKEVKTCDGDQDSIMNQLTLLKVHKGINNKSIR